MARSGPLRILALAALSVSVTALSSATAMAQPADLPVPPATTTQFPPGVTVRDTPAGPVYADARGRTLYGLDLRTLLRWTSLPPTYCKQRCPDWEPLLAPADARVNLAYPGGFEARLRQAIESGAQIGGGGAGQRPASGNRPRSEDDADPDFFTDPQKAPDWTVIAGPAGPQWVYKGWHMIYTRKDDAPGSTAFDGDQDFTWNTLKYVPPRPAVVAPAHVTTVLAGGNWALADKDGHVLFTGECRAGCEPLGGGLASRGIGEWTIDRSSDRPQWAWRGRRVYASRMPDPLMVPEGGEAMRP